MKKQWFGLLLAVILLVACSVAMAAEIYVEGTTEEQFTLSRDGVENAEWIDPPAVVKGLTVNNHVYLSWDTVYGVDYYNVYRKVEGGWKFVKKTVSPYYECTMSNGEHRFAVSSCKTESSKKTYESSTRTAVTVLVQNGGDKPGKNDIEKKIYARGTEDKTVTVEVRDNTYLHIKSEALTIIMDGNGAMIFPMASADDKYYFRDLGGDVYLKASKYLNGNTGTIKVYTYYFSRMIKNGYTYYVREEERAFFTIQLKKVESLVSMGVKYEINNATKTATVVGVSNEEIQIAQIAAILLYDGVQYTVTEIADNAFNGLKKLEEVKISANIKTIGKKAFYGCKNLKTIQIDSTYLTSKNVGKEAFKNIYKKATIKCPSKKLKDYKSILLSKGVPKTAKFKKN